MLVASYWNAYNCVSWALARGVCKPAIKIAANQNRLQAEIRGAEKERLIIATSRPGTDRDSGTTLSGYWVTARRNPRPMPHLGWSQRTPRNPFSQRKSHAARERNNEKAG